MSFISLAKIDPELFEFLNGTIGVVECDYSAQNLLWEKYHMGEKFSWEQNLSGHGRQVGILGDMPIAISLCNAKIKGHKILFVHATSVVADHRIIDQWLDDHLPKSAFRKDGYVNKTDAGNFCNIFPREPVAG